MMQQDCSDPGTHMVSCGQHSSASVSLQSLHPPVNPRPHRSFTLPAWGDPSWSRHSPTGFVLLAADAAAAEQGEQEDEQQRQEGPCPDHPHPLVGLCKADPRLSPGPALWQSPAPSPRHSPMWQAPVRGSQAPSWQLQTLAQLAP